MMVKERNGLRLFLLSLSFVSLCILDILSSTNLDLGEKLNQLLLHANNCPNAMIRHHNRFRKVPQLSAVIIPAAQYKNQCRNLEKNKINLFHGNKLSRKS